MKSCKMPFPSPSHKSDSSRGVGVLYVVATPIGNMEDITIRAIRILKEVDLIAAEDTREAGRLMAHHGINGSFVSYHEFNEIARCGPLIDKLKSGLNIALISDAGTPSVSDPGFRLVQAAIENHIDIVPIPGVSAVTAALSVAGLPTDSFVFVGFLSKKAGRRTQQLEALAREPRTVIFYESPKRLMTLLHALFGIFGDRQAVLSREMTKSFEEFQRGRLSEIIPRLAQRPVIKGECTLLVAGCESDGIPPAPECLESELLEALGSPGVRPSEVVQRIAAKYNCPKKKIYEQVMKIKGELTNDQ